MKQAMQRRARAVDLIAKAGLGAVAFVPGPHFEYLTDVRLHLMERATLFVLSANGAMHAVMPSIEKQKWSSAMPEVKTFYSTDADGPAEAFASLAEAVGTHAPIGVEGLRMRLAEYLALADHWSHDGIVDADQYLEELRLLKNRDEISELREAIRISEDSLGEIYKGGIAGRKEIEIAGRLKAAMLSHGATGFAFDPIVLAGGNAANPHGEPGEKKVQPGEVLLIDFGASYGQMHADITRTVFCEYVSDDHAQIYETVRAANEAGRSAAGPGRTVGDVDAAATDVLAASSFAELIVHKTGHGLGREVHEAPQIKRSNCAPQLPGMVYTIEPGLYREGDIGVRIEDNVVVTEEGHDCLTRFSRELMTIA